MSGPELKQRLGAILAADVAGYSRLMSQDERATVEALDVARAVFRRQIEAGRGRVVDMAGDSVLAVFETATGAVSAALAVQRELQESTGSTPEERRMRFRIGIHLGDVIEKSDGTVYGDGVNIAARLEGLAESGGITVSESIHTAVRGKVTALFEDQGEQTVKNIAHPVRAYRVRTEGAAPVKATLAVANAGKPAPAHWAIDLSLPDKPSIAVLAFTNMSGDPEQEYFTDGITEDIITELSRFHSLFVIARNSSFSYKGKSPDIRVVGQELGVRYVVEGSIRRSGNRIRVTAQLIDAATGNHIWAEKYDRVLEDVFAVQEELTQAIVRAIAPNIDMAESAKLQRYRPENLSAYELALHAREMVHDAWAKSDWILLAKGISAARSALIVDPRSTIALNALGFGIWLSVYQSLDKLNDVQALQEGMAVSARAIEIDPLNSTSYALRAGFQMIAPGMLAAGLDQIEEARLNLCRGIELNSNDSLVLRNSGLLELAAGNWHGVLAPQFQVLRLSPRDWSRRAAHTTLAIAYVALKDYPAASMHVKQALSDAPDAAVPNLEAAAIHVCLNDLPAAHAAFEKAQALAPKLMQRRLTVGIATRDVEYRQRHITLLRIAAGLEDPSAADALR